MRGDDFTEVMTLELGSWRMNKCPRGSGAFQAMGMSLERPECLTKAGEWLGEAAVRLVMSAGSRQSLGPGQ